MSAENNCYSRNKSEKMKESGSQSIEFEGIQIQWGKKTWEFMNGSGASNTIDTYSIWNPENWDEIATRLVEKQICGMYIMGNYGTGEIREAPEWQKEGLDTDVIFDKIKKRSKDQNFVAFSDPEDIIKFIDIDRLPKQMQGFRWAQNRINSYAGPQHNIFPVRDNGMVDSGLIRKEDNTIACFWIPGHWGYEAISDKMKKKTKHGIFGGGSLNIHGQEPCYTTEALYEEITKQSDWQENIDFIIMDEFAEASQIGRSQTMISFVKDIPQLLRLGSMSPARITEKTGFEIPFNYQDIEEKRVKTASSLTPFNQKTNEESNRKVDEVMDRITRYKNWYLSPQDHK